MHLLRFLKSVVAEMKLVVWPTAAENRRDTTVVISLTVFFVLFFALFDWLIQSGLLAFTK
ncbi:preprotein translocase subunit SecE [Paucilactobacillus sp. N302-9]|jgi:preprotein translocase subunit SecE